MKGVITMKNTYRKPFFLSETISYHDILTASDENNSLDNVAAGVEGEAKTSFENIIS